MAVLAHTSFEVCKYSHLLTKPEVCDKAVKKPRKRKGPASSVDNAVSALSTTFYTQPARQIYTRVCVERGGRCVGGVRVCVCACVRAILSHPVEYVSSLQSCIFLGNIITSNYRMTFVRKQL